MTIEAGAQLGHYEVEGTIGAGGMGQVYRARDTRLQRIVALKVLPQKLASGEGRERFEREARAVATLSHPNICALFDVGEHEGIHYLVLEYLEGETLADRLKRQVTSSTGRRPPSASTLRAQSRGPMTIDRVIDIGIAVAAALEAAHKQGIVHRDLKPGNVMLTKAGVKLLDFGLAKLLDEPQAKAKTGDTGAPTAALTGQAQMLGTLQYMAPEQLEGTAIDGRSDIFALGAILYEMATGRRPFVGQSDASLIAAILEHEPEPPSRLAPDVPPALDRLILTCLRKDPEERWHSAADVKHELRWIGSGGDSGVAVAPPPRRRTRAWWAAIAGTACLGVAAGWLLQRTPAPPARAGVALALLAPKMDDASWMALSPDGRKLAYVAADDEGYSRVWVRPIEAFAATPLPETQGALDVAWLADNKSLLFVSTRGLCLIEPDKSLVRTLHEGVDNIHGATANASGDILYSDQHARMFHVERPGGQPKLVYNDDKSRTWPAFLPDNRHFLVLRIGVDPGIYLGELGSAKQERLVQGKYERMQVDTARGYVLVGASTVVSAFAFDFDEHRIKSQAYPILEGIDNLNDGPAFTAASGNVVYARAKKTSHQLTWFAPDGTRLGSFGPPGTYFSFDLSPDETSVLVARENTNNRMRHIALIDSIRGTSTIVASGNGTADDPLWLPDGQRFSYVLHGIPSNVFTQSLTGGSRETIVSEEGTTFLPESWAADEKTLLIVRYRYPIGWSLVAWRAEQKDKGAAGLEELVASHSSQPEEPSLSRQGDLLAYGAKSQGHWDVFLMRMPDSGDRWQVSVNGGVQPRWSADGKSLYYLTPDGKLMHVQVERTGEHVRPGRPKMLFATPLLRPSAGADQYRVTKDGQRVLLALPTAEDQIQLNVVTDWPTTFGLPQAP